MYVLVVAISGGDVVATSVVAKSAPSPDHDVPTDLCEGVGVECGCLDEGAGRLHQPRRPLRLGRRLAHLQTLLLLLLLGTTVLERFDKCQDWLRFQTIFINNNF